MKKFLCHPKKPSLISRHQSEMTQNSNLLSQITNLTSELETSKENFKLSLEKLNTDLIDTKKLKIQLQADADSLLDEKNNLLAKIDDLKLSHEKEIGEMRSQTQKMLGEQKSVRGFGGCWKLTKLLFLF